MKLHPILPHCVSKCGTVSANMYITLQDKADYTLTAVETTEHVYTECADKHWAEQSVCTTLDENDVTHSVLLGSKNVRKGGALILNFDRT